MNVHQKNLRWDEGVLSGPFFCRRSFFFLAVFFSPCPTALFFLAETLVKMFLQRTVTAKNPFLLSNSNWNSNNQVIRSSKQLTHTRPLTIFSHTLCFPAQMEQTVRQGKNQVRRLDHADLSLFTIDTANLEQKWTVMQSCLWRVTTCRLCFDKNDCLFSWKQNYFKASWVHWTAV